VDIIRIEAFLAVAQELHFGRAAERLNLSQPRVSRLIAALEHEVGAVLFERTSRQVRLTPLGEQLRDGLLPAHRQLKATFDEVRSQARGKAGLLRIGVTETTAGNVVTRLVKQLGSSYPNIRTTVHGVSGFEPFKPLRAHEIDVLINWLALDEPDMTLGPAIDHRDRMLAVGRDHPFASRRSVSFEEIAEYEVASVPEPFPRALFDALVPPRTPSGKPIRRTHPARSTFEILSLVACGSIIHPTVASVAPLNRSDIKLIPIKGMVPLPLGLIWCTAHENARVLALAEVARTFAALAIEQ